jgi:hypothetical protein
MSLRMWFKTCNTTLSQLVKLLFRSMWQPTKALRISWLLSHVAACQNFIHKQSDAGGLLLARHAIQPNHWVLPSRVWTSRLDEVNKDDVGFNPSTQRHSCRLIYYLYIHSYMFRPYDHHQAEKHITTLGLLNWQQIRCFIRSHITVIVYITSILRITVMWDLIKQRIRCQLSSPKVVIYFSAWWWSYDRNM